MKDAIVSLVSLLILLGAGFFVSNSLAEYLFLSVAAIIVFAAVRVVLSNSAVHSALFLMLTFFSTAVLWVLQGAEFVGVVLLLVYVGAVMVLLLFVVMMVSEPQSKTREIFWQNFPAAFVVGVIAIVEMAVVLWRVFSDNALLVFDIQKSVSQDTTKMLSEMLFGEYALAFEIVGLILLVGMIGAVVLTLGERKKVKSQHVSEQVKVKKEDRLVIRKDPRSPN